MGNSWLQAGTAFVLLFVLTINSACALQVEFFQKPNYTDFHEGIQKKTGEDGDCFNLQSSYFVRSIKTDKCLILYDKENCQIGKKHIVHIAHARFAFYSVRVNTNTPQFNADETLTYWPDFRVVTSFHVCSQERGGGPALDLDYYDKPYLDAAGGRLVQEWRDVCTCQNVPKRIRGGKSREVSIDNHGNDVEVFSEEYCGGESRHLPAGDNVATRDMFANAPKFDIASFRPAGLLDCIKLEARIFKFYFKNGTSSDGVKEEKVKLAAQGQIINDGPAETKQEYEVSEKVTETVEFSVADGYRSMHTAGAEVSVETSFEAGIPLLGKTDVTTKISAKYEYTREDTSTTTNTNTVSTETAVRILQTVTAPGCHSCTINGYVKQAKDFPIDYDSYSKISGYGGGTRLKAEEIKGYLPAGVDYVRDVDEFTVEAVTQGTMYAKFGVKTLIDVKCEPIPNCVSSSDNNEPITVHYEIPFESVDDEGHLKSGYQYTDQIGTAMGHYWNTLSEKV